MVLLTDDGAAELESGTSEDLLSVSLSWTGEFAASGNNGALLLGLGDHLVSCPVVDENLPVVRVYEDTTMVFSSAPRLRIEALAGTLSEHDNEGVLTPNNTSLCLALLVGIASGCQGIDLPDDRKWSSDHFVYHTREGDDSVCPGIVDTLEQHFESISDYLRFQWPEGKKIHYYKFSDVGDLKNVDPCPLDAGGCHEKGRIYSSRPLDLHELIHAYLDPTGLPPRLFSEGIAETYSCKGLVLSEPVSMDWRDVIADDTWEDKTVYRIGHRLVGNLMNTYGPKKFLEMYGQIPFTASETDIERAFEAVYDVSLDEVWATANAIDDPASLCIFAWECAASPQALDSTKETLLGACDQSDRYRSFELLDQTTVSLETGPHFVYLRSCTNVTNAPDGQEVDGLALNPYGPHFVDLEPGRYFLRSDAETEVTASAFTAPPFGESCEDLAPLQTGDVPKIIEIARLATGRPWMLRISPPELVQLVVESEGPSSQEICSTCDQSDCVAFNGTYDGSEDVVLRFETGAADDGYAKVSLRVNPI